MQFLPLGLLHINRRPMCGAALGALFAVVLFYILHLESVSALSVGFVLLAAVLVLAFRFRLFIPAASLCIVFISCCLQFPGAPDISAGTVTGTISDIFSYTDGRTDLTVTDVTVDGIRLRGNVILRLTKACPAVPGDLIECNCTFPDYMQGSYSDISKRVALRGYPEAASLQVTGRDSSAMTLLYDLKGRLSAAMRDLFPEHSSIAAGLLLGSSAAYRDDPEVEQFRDLGISHVLAVSGLHVGIIAGAVMVLLRYVPSAGLRAVILCRFLLFYCAITAFTPSVVRASVMLLCVTPAGPLCRRTDLPSSLSLAFLIILIVYPFSIYGIGFCLSFAAVAGFFTFAPKFKAGFAVLGEKVAGTLSASVSAILSSLPVVAMFAGSVSLSSIPANLLILPVVPVYMISALLCLLLYFIFPAAACFAAAAPRFALELMVRISAAGNAVALMISEPSVPAVALYYLGMLSLSDLLIAEQKRKHLISTLLFTMSALLWSI